MWRLLLTEAIHTQLHTVCTLAVAGHTHTYVRTIVSQSCWLHGCMLIMSSAVQYSYNSNILTCCGIHWMAKSTRTRQCLLSHVSSGTRTQLNAHLFRVGISFVGAACFHRDSLDALAASSSSQLQQPEWCQVCISVCVCVCVCVCAHKQDGGFADVGGVLWQVYLCMHACVCTRMPWCVTVCTCVTFALAMPSSHCVSCSSEDSFFFSGTPFASRGHSGSVC